jgi:hypothetical protein
MSSIPTTLPQVAEGSNAVAKVNDLFDAATQTMIGARNVGTSALLTWGYIGGRVNGITVANGTVTLTASTTNYVVMAKATGVVSTSTATTNWNDSANYWRLYQVTTGSTAVTSALDERSSSLGLFGLGQATITLDNDPALAANSSTSVATQQATKSYVDGKVNGLSWKQQVRAATTANGTLASAFANGQTIDGVTLATGDRILLKNQSTSSENGIYVVAASGAPARAGDADAGAELVNASMYVSEGSTLADTQWVCTNNSPITLGSTAVAFAQVTGGGSVAWGAVTGTLSNQTDLQAALDLKQNRSPSIQTVTSSATVTPTFSNDMVKITAQAAGLTLANPTGTAIDGLGMVIRIKDNGTARTIAYGTQYRAIGVALPTTTVISKTLYLAMVFNNDDTKWDVVAVGQEA